MGKLKKQSFVTGAAILMIANAISKILGAVFKIPLTYILKEEGMAVFNTSFQAYIMLLTFVISGFPFAISKLVAESASRGETAKTRAVTSVSAKLLSVIGIAGSAALYFGAPFFAIAMKEEKAVFAIRALAPAIFFVALGVPYKGYFQGVSNMIPTAASQVVEAVVKLAAGYALSVSLINIGAAAAAGGATAGVAAGEIIATAILMGIYLFGKREEKRIKMSFKEEKEIIRAILAVAVPLLCASAVTDMMNVLDTTMVRTRLLDAGLGAEEARFLYGAYTGYALTVFHLPVGILATLGVSILPVIAGAIAVGNEGKARRTTELALELTVFIALPCAAVMFFQSGSILKLLFSNDTSAAMLSLVAPCAVMMCVSQICAAVLQSAGKITQPFFFMLIGSLIKLAASFFLVGDPRFNIYGSAISSDIAYFVIMVLNLAAVSRHLKLKLKLSALAVKPALSAAVMCAVIYLLRAPVYAYTDSSFLRLLIVCSVSFAAYALTLALTGAVSVKNIRKIFK